MGISPLIWFAPVSAVRQIRGMSDTASFAGHFGESGLYDTVCVGYLTQQLLGHQDFLQLQELWRL